MGERDNRHSLAMLETTPIKAGWRASGVSSALQGDCCTFATLWEFFDRRSVGTFT